jgi:hypothetical protein
VQVLYGVLLAVDLQYKSSAELLTNRADIDRIAVCLNNIAVAMLLIVPLVLFINDPTVLLVIKLSCIAAVALLCAGVLVAARLAGVWFPGGDEAAGGKVSAAFFGGSTVAGGNNSTLLKQHETVAQVEMEILSNRKYVSMSFVHVLRYVAVLQQCFFVIIISITIIIIIMLLSLFFLLRV